jgi:hypothetical protein
MYLCNFCQRIWIEESSWKTYENERIILKYYGNSARIYGMESSASVCG